MSQYSADVYDVIGTGISKTADVLSTYITEDTKRMTDSSGSSGGGGGGPDQGGGNLFEENTPLILAGVGAILLIGVIFAMRR